MGHSAYEHALEKAAVRYQKRKQIAQERYDYERAVKLAKRGFPAALRALKRKPK
jgi:hypothetical protein